MDYLTDPHSYSRRSKHDSFLQPSSYDAYGYSRTSRSSTRLDVPSSTAPVSRNKSVHERERRPYHHEHEHRSRSSVRREETFPAYSKRSTSIRRTNSWPPPPSVEDEDEALAKEFPRSRKAKEAADEVCMPGTIDQNPVLIELENHDRRFVLIPKDETAAEQPAPKSSRRRSDRPDLKLNVEEPKLFDRRQPSPYAFTRNPQAPSHDNLTESRAPHERKTPRSETSSSSSKSRRNAQTETRTSNSSSDERHTDDSDLEPAAVSRLRERKAQPRVSFTEPASSSRPRPEIKRFSSDYTSPTERRTKPISNGGSALKSAMKTPTSAPTSDDEGPTRVRTRMSSSNYNSPMTSQGSAIPIASSIPQHIRAESMYSGSRPALSDYEGSAQPRSYPAPPELPRDIDTTSSFGSHPSMRSSRQNSPVASAFEAKDFADEASRRSDDYSNGYDFYGSDNKRQNRSIPDRVLHDRQASLEQPFRPRGGVSVPVASALPYPVDEPMVHMPNHENYIETPTTPTVPMNFPSAGGSTVLTESLVTSPEVVQTPMFATRPRTTSNVSNPSTTRTRSEGQLAIPTTLPPCPRTEYSRDFDDWYTSRHDQSLDVCPTCFDEIVGFTSFRSDFLLAPRRDANMRTKCDFGAPWTRMAWLLTLKRRRQDLSLIYALSQISSRESKCPGSRDGSGPWYGLLGEDGKFVSGFAICSRDTRFVETCFPSCLGLFARMPSPPSGREEKMCSMRVSSRRFPTFLDLLEDIDEEAQTMPLQSCPSVKSLLRFARAHSPRKSCPRDSRLRDVTWHFIPIMPEFTVCEECFDEVIWPSLKQGSDIANKFTRVLTPLPPGVEVDGMSCQLYSDRMRRVWDQSIRKSESEGMAYLNRKALERSEVELNLRRYQDAIAEKLDRNKRKTGTDASIEKERLKRALVEIEQDWAKWE